MPDSENKQIEIVIGPDCQLTAAHTAEFTVLRHDDEQTITRDLHRPGVAALILNATHPDSLLLTQNIRKKTQLIALPILFAGADTPSPAIREEARRAGVTDFICTSEDPAAIQNRIRAFAALFQTLKTRESQFLNTKLEGAVQFLDSLVENLPAMIFVKDAKDLRFVLFNRAGEDLLGFDRKDLIGKNDYDFFPKEQADHFTSKDRAVLNSGHLLDVAEEPIQTKSGTRVLHTKKIPLYDESGLPSFLLGISEDITGRKEAEAEKIKLVQAEAARSEAEAALERLTILADAMPIMVMISDARGKVEFLNRRWYEYTGLDPASGDLSGWIKAMHPLHISTCVERAHHCLQTGEPFEIEFMLRGSDGTYRWHIGRALPHRDANGNILKWYGSSMDVHAQKMAQEKIESLVGDLRNAISVRDEFLSVASHELKTPVTSLKLQIQMAQRFFLKKDKIEDGPERLERMVNISGRQVDRLVRLIEDLLDVSRIQSGKIAYNFEALDLPTFVREVVEKMQDQLALGRCPVQWKRIEPCSVSVDRSRMEQVLVNLLTNTIKYGAGRPVELSVHAEGTHARVVVTDHGIGIDPAKQQLIFERFERAISSRNISGLGLGLYIAKQITQGHQGQILVESTVGQGSTFTVEIPLTH